MFFAKLVLLLVFVGSALRAADTKGNPCVSMEFANRDKGDVPFVTNQELLQVSLTKTCTTPDLVIKMKLERETGLVRTVSSSMVEMVRETVFESPEKTLPSERRELVFDPTAARLLERGVYHVTISIDDGKMGVSGCAGTISLKFVVRDDQGD